MNGKRLIACAMAGLLSLQTALSMPGIYAVAAEPTTEVTDNTVLSSEDESQTEEDTTSSDSGNEGVDNSSSSDEYDVSSEAGEEQSIEETQGTTGNEDSTENNIDTPNSENGEGIDAETQVQPDSGNQQDEGSAGQEDETVTELPADDSRSEVVTEIPVEQTVETEVPVDIAPVEITEELPAVGSDDNDALFEEYVDGLFHGGAANNRGRLKAKRVRQFDGAAGLVYDTIQAGAKQIAVGERGSTEFTFTRDDLGYQNTSWSASDLKVPEIVTSGAISETAKKAAIQKFEEDVNISDIIDALLASNPYDFYWYAKTTPTPNVYSVGAMHDGTEYRIYIAKYTVSFPVAQEYAADKYRIDTNLVSTPVAAAENARSIINQKAGLGDIEKLKAYKDIICEWVDYNHDAADNDNTPYGNPWQMIWVFDKDPATKVVCEGYSKAFQYLCDESSFVDSQISCRTVTGSMDGGTGAGDHMWNLVTLNDGKTYLADITNCDADSVGAPDLLFLASCASGNVNEGYQFSCNESSIVYGYDDSTKSLYSEEELTVSGTAYDPASIPEEIEYSGSCGENAVWSLEEGVLTISGSGMMADFDSTDSVPWRKSLDEINKVVIEDGVTSIGSFAFTGCTALTSVTIPVSVGAIGASAFENTNQEKDIYYASSLSAWNQISVSGTGNDSLSSAVMHYVVQIHISADANTTVRVRVGSADAVEEESDESLLSDGDYVDSGTVLTVNRTAGTGYELIGQEQEEITVGGDNVEITAASKIRTYVVTLHYENGEAPTCSEPDLTAVERSTSVTVTAGAANDGYEFAGWYQTNGKLLTAEKIYTFAVYSNVTIEARYQKVSGVVRFVSNEQLQKSMACSSVTLQDFPADPAACYGFVFTRWDLSVEEINAGLKEGKSVTVKALFSPAPSEDGFDVSIFNGEKETPVVRSFRDSSVVSVKAETVAGKNFSHWLLDGELLSYNTTAAFRATKECTLKAVYSIDEVQAQGTAVLKTASYNNATRKLSLNAYLTAPDGAVIRKAGLVAAFGQNSKYNPSEELTKENADYVKSLAAAEGKGGAVSYTWIKTKVGPGDVWYARAYLCYELNGKEETVYGNLRKIHAGEDFDTDEKGTAEIRSSEYLPDIEKAKFVAYLTVPDQGEIEKAGLVAESGETFDPVTDVLTSSNAAYAKSLAAAVGKTGAVSYTWIKKNVKPGDIWYARAWLVYKDADGKEHTVYGPLETLDTSGFIKTYEAPTSVSLSDKGIVSMSISETEPHTVMLGLYRQAAAAAGTMSTMSVKGAGLRNAPAADADELVAVVPARINGETSYSVNVSNLISEAGTYYVTAKAVGSADEKNARDMTVGTDSAVSSDPVPFTRPDQSLDVPENVTWDPETYGRARWSEVPGADSYQVMLYSGDDIVASRNINTTYFNFSSGWIDYNNIASKQYTFTVTAMSGNISEISNSAQSDRSAVLGELPSRDPVSIVTQPADKYGSLGKTVTASLAASGIGLTYDWYVDGEKITDGADDATVKLDSSKARTMSVYCTVHDAFGNNVTSDQAQVTVVDDSPMQGFIQVQPSDVATDPDLQYKEFHIATASLQSGFRATYKWYVDYGSGYTFNGSTSAGTLIKATPSNNGAKVKCHVTVTAPTGRIVFDEDSTEAVLHVNEKPIVIEQDLDDDYYRETERFVYLYAVGENLTYQWYFEGMPVSGATTSAFDLTRVTNSWGTSPLYCRVSNGTTSVDSKRAQIHNGGNPATAISIRQIGSLDTDHLAVGDVVELQAVLTPDKSTSEVRWQSTDPSVATVNNGTVTILGQGSSLITAFANNKRAEFLLTADSYRIEFDPAGGVFADGETANRVIRAVQDSDVEFPSVFREDNTFLGWTLDGSTVVNSLKATDNLRLYAKWEKSTEQEDAELAIEQDLAEKQYARIGTDALFEVVTNGAKVKKYQWYVMDRSGSGWTEVNTGVTNDGTRTSLIVPASASNNGYTYKVIVTPFNGKPVESSPSVLLTGSTEAEPQDNMKLFFTSNPVDVNTYLDQTAVFSAAVNVENAEFRWQYSVHGGEEWVTLSGETGSTLTLEHVQEDMNGRLFRCIATYDGETKYSGTATLTINTNAAKVKSVSITAWNNLITVDSSYPSGEEIRIDSIVEKEDGEGEDKELVYEWQETDDGGTTWWPAENYSYEDPSIFIRPIDFELPDETTYFTYRLVVNGVASEPVDITVTQTYSEPECTCGCGMPEGSCGPDCSGCGSGEEMP